MGCNSSQIHVQSPEPMKPSMISQIQSEMVLLDNRFDENLETTRSLKVKSKQKIEKQDFKQWCFLFGQTPIDRRIVCFDIKQLQFSTISSRMKIPEPVLKYQPIEVIYQQSQELFSSALFAKNSSPPYNFMLAIWLDTRRVFLCGGVTFDFDFVSSEAYVFDTKTITSVQPSSSNKLGNNLMGTKLQKLSFMTQKRYSHMGVLYTVGLLKYIYVFGGRGQNDQLLSSCERYSLLQKKWTKIAPMKKARSTGFSFVYKNKIYVCGGYSEKPKRSKKIQVYCPEKDYWQVLNVKMHRGLQTGLIFSIKPNQLIFIGGNLQYGSTNSVVQVNLLEQTYIAVEELNHCRVLSKGCITKKDIIVFGGSLSDGIEVYDYSNKNQKQWKQNNSCLFSGHIKTEEINSFSYSTETVEVEYEEPFGKQNHQIPSNITDQRVFIFSHDSKPFILDINFTTKQIIKKAVPMSLRLRSHMCCLFIKAGKYFITGGVSEYYQKATKSTYIYYVPSNRAIEQAKMLTSRYKFASCIYNNNVYVFGGKYLQEDPPLLQCQIFNLQQNYWKQIAPLNIGRYSSKAVVIKDNIYILGGSNGIRDLQQIQIYNPQTNTMFLIDTNLKLIPNILSIQSNQSVFVFGGKSESEQQVFKIEIDQTPQFRKKVQLQQVLPLKGQKVSLVIQQSQLNPSIANQQTEQIIQLQSKLKTQQNIQINLELKQQQEQTIKQQVEQQKGQKQQQYVPFIIQSEVKVTFQPTQYKIPSLIAAISMQQSIYLISSQNKTYKWNLGQLEQITLQNKELLNQVDWERVTIA